MIGFFQNSMAKHHRLVFGVLLVFIVVSFVFYTGSGSAADLLGIRRSASIMGVNLNNEEDAMPFKIGAALSTRDGRISTQDVANRIFLVKLAESYRIPEPTQAQFGDFLKENGLSVQVIDNLKEAYSVSDDVLKVAFVHSWKIRQFLQTFSESPSAFAADVSLKWKEANTRWKIETAELSRQSVPVSVPEPSDEELQAFFAANQEKFRIEKKIRLSCAKVALPADFIQKIPDPTEYELSAFVSEKFNHEATKVLTDLEKNRAARIAEWKSQQALDTFAAELSNKLYEKLPTDVYSPSDSDFAETVEKSGFAFAEIPPFPQSAVPADTGVPAEILKSAASGLNDTLWRTDAIPADGTVYVVIYRGAEPSRIPELGEVKPAVSAACVEQAKRRAFLKIAEEKGAALRKAVEGGADFSETAKAQGFAVDSAEFLSSTVPEKFAGTDLVSSLKAVPASSVSPLLQSGENALFAKTVSRTIPALDAQSDDFKKFLAWLDRNESWTTLQVQISADFSALAGSIGLGVSSAEE